MPFFIPVVLVAVGAATGGGGVALGGKGAYDLKKANERAKKAACEYEQRRAVTENKLESSNQKLKALGMQQEQALIDVVVRMGDFLRRHERQVRESDRLLVEGIGATMTQVPEQQGLEMEAAAFIGGALGAAVAGAGTGAGVTAAAGSLGVASTGAAIGGLSGAAAESATLAFLGGGSLASGGGGMALGAAALNFVTIGPALLVGGLVVKGQGAKAITKAREREAEIAVAIAELDETEVRLEGVDARADELGDLLAKLSAQATSALDILESEPFDSQVHAPRFQRAMSLVMAVRDVAATPIIDAEGTLTERSANLTVKYRAMAEETADA
ncbi:hypothetical protein [Actinomadura sp. WMMA1423]|uniref:hypothetical protein n=1 Tax=Actinomadura sp. WMMA1423 TaxID=2591108 RepID=UPI001146A437|nr:hypothetical protein [Actinomadura sp. WMMA1423]